MTRRRYVQEWTSHRRWALLKKCILPSEDEAGRVRKVLDYVAVMEKRGKAVADCSCGCRHFYTLAQDPDFGVCLCSEGPRCGLLTFEHQGCNYFQPGEGGGVDG